MPLWIKEAAGQPYMPSNGTEGACFHEMHCSNAEITGSEAVRVD
jgi:hypothetical protein